MLPKKWSLHDIVALTLMKGVTSVRIKDIVDKFDSYEAFINSDYSVKILKLQGDLFNISSTYTNQAQDCVGNCEKNNINIITYWDSSYPDLLKEINYPPTILYVRGTLQKPDSICIAIVGTRNSTVYGKLAAERFAEYFAANDIIVVSGLAHGIDTFSHNATLRAQGTTYAVLASGLDTISPSIARKNAERIVDGGGTLISEYRCGYLANLGSFPQRNRIISGISRAVLVVESGIKGGSLITARLAANESREVFAVPGNITSEKSEGTNMLIRTNTASLASSPSQILEDLGLSRLDLVKKGSFQRELTFNHPNEEKIYNTISYEPVHIDKIFDETGIEISEGLVRLLELEFRGIIRQLPGKYYVKP
ncbi:MAG: DNA-processing protein DprA [Candidatus Kapabacteria bacterium]|nr:DNA-processing protein DprA [Ignavibacteriota bacterium]MCW5886423.1 DNA-processing protein DprA [Candidatus Kapabacteria bacterium]